MQDPGPWMLIPRGNDATQQQTQSTCATTADTLQVCIVSTASDGVSCPDKTIEQDDRREDEGSALLQAFQEHSSMQHSRGSRSSTHTSRMSLKAMYTVVRGGSQTSQPANCFGAFEQLPSSTSAAPSASVTPATTTNADAFTDSNAVDEAPPAFGAQPDMTDTARPVEQQSTEATVPMLEGTYVGFPLLWVPTNPPTPRTMPQQATHKATHFTVSAALRQRPRNTALVLARRVGARLHRFLAEALLLSNLPHSNLADQGGQQPRSLQTLLQEASTAVVELCTQHVLQQGAVRSQRDDATRTRRNISEQAATALGEANQALNVQVAALTQQVAGRQQGIEEAQRKQEEMQKALETLQGTCKTTKAKHQRQLQQRGAEFAELQLHASSMHKEVQRVTKLLTVAQREAAVHKHAAAQATARANQRVVEARIQVEALRRHGASSLSTPTGISHAQPSATLSRPLCPAVGSLPGFAALCSAYNNMQQRGASQTDHTARRLRVALSSKPSVSRDPATVSRHVAKLCCLAAAQGMMLAMEACGPCRWRVAGCMLTLHVADTRLVARTGGGYEDVLCALARLPAHAVVTTSRS